MAVTVKCWPMPSMKFFLSGHASTLEIHAPSSLVTVIDVVVIHDDSVHLDPPTTTPTLPSSGFTPTNIALISVVVVVVVVAVVLAVMLFIVSFMFYQNKGTWDLD